jgi:hypothetical protein
MGKKKRKTYAERTPEEQIKHLQRAIGKFGDPNGETQAKIDIIRKKYSL